MSAFTLTANKGTGGGFEKAPAGNHPAVLVAAIDMGTQRSEYGGEVKEQHRAFFVWELPGERMSGSNRTHVIGIDLTLSLNEKAKLRKWIEARTGKPIPDGGGYDVSTELGQPCLLNVIEKGGYPKIDGVSALPKGMPAPKASYPLTEWNLADFAKTGEIKVPEWVPYLFGEHLSSHIKRCNELVNGTVRPPEANGAPAAASPPANAATPPPRRRAPAERTYWVDFGDDGKTPRELLPESRVRELHNTQPDHDWKLVEVCPAGTDDWQPFYAAFPDVIPF